MLQSLSLLSAAHLLVGSSWKALGLNDNSIAPGVKPRVLLAPHSLLMCGVCNIVCRKYLAFLCKSASTKLTKTGVCVPKSFILLSPFRQLEPLSSTASAAVSPTKGPTAQTVPSLAAGLVGLNASEDQEPEGPYKPKLSKHEQQLMQQAHQRHQANITTKQVTLCYASMWAMSTLMISNSFNLCMKLRLST